MKVAHAIGGFTLLLAVFGCREVSTDLQRRNPTDPSPRFDVAANRTTVFHFVANGDFGNVSWSANSLFCFASVSTGDTLGLSYFIFQFDPCCSSASGVGPVPVSDFTGSGGGRLVLNTNTCADPGFLTFEGACGLVSIEFDKTSFFTGRNQGTSSQTFGDFTFHSVGTSEFSSAQATGTVVGFPITSPNDGSMGMNHNVAVSISR